MASPCVEVGGPRLEEQREHSPEDWHFRSAQGHVVWGLQRQAGECAPLQWGHSRWLSAGSSIGIDFHKAHLEAESSVDRKAGELRQNDRLGGCRDNADF